MHVLDALTGRKLHVLTQCVAIGVTLRAPEATRETEDGEIVGDASSLSFGLEGEHVELHVGPAAMQMVAWMAAAGCRAAPMSTRVVNETPLPLVFGQVGTLIASLISSDCLPHQL